MAKKAWGVFLKGRAPHRRVRSIFFSCMAFCSILCGRRTHLFYFLVVHRSNPEFWFERPSGAPASTLPLLPKVLTMSDLEWTYDMDGVLLRSIAADASAPGAFPEETRGRQSDDVKSFWERVVASFSERGWNVTAREVRKRAAFFLADLEPLSATLHLIIQATRAAEEEGVTVETLLARIERRNEERERAGAYRTANLRGGPSAASERSSSAAESSLLPSRADQRCLCNDCISGSSTSCPYSGRLHFVLSQSTPAAMSAAGASSSTQTNTVETYLIISGDEPPSHDCRSALLAAVALQCGLPSEKEGVFVALLRKSIAGVVVDDLGLQRTPLDADTQGVRDLAT